MRTNLNFVKRAVVFRVAMILAFGNGAFDCRIGVAAGRIVFHEKISFQGFLPSGVISMARSLEFIREIYEISFNN